MDPGVGRLKGYSLLQTGKHIDKGLQTGKHIDKCLISYLSCFLTLIGTFFSTEGRIHSIKIKEAQKRNISLPKENTVMYLSEKAQ